MNTAKVLTRLDDKPLWKGRPGNSQIIITEVNGGNDHSHRRLGESRPPELTDEEAGKIANMAANIKRLIEQVDMLGEALREDGNREIKVALRKARNKLRERLHACMSFDSGRKGQVVGVDYMFIKTANL